MNTRVFNFEYTPPRPASLSSHLLLILVLGRSACGGRGPGDAGALPCGPLWPWTTPLPTRGGQPPCGRCRGMPTAAAAGTDALRWTSLQLAHAPVALLFKNHPGERGGAGRPAWTTLRVDHPGHRAHPCPEALPAGRQRPRGARVPKGTRGGAAQGVQGACRPLRRSAIGAGRRPWGTWTPPLGGLLIPCPTTRARG